MLRVRSNLNRVSTSSRILSVAFAVTVALMLSACGSANDESTTAATSANTSPEPQGLRFEPFVSDLGVPRQLEDLGDGTLLVSDQRGQVWVIEEGAIRSEPALDVSAFVLPPSQANAELGLAGFALAPDFAESGVVYTYTTEKGTSTTRTDVLRSWIVDPKTLTWNGAESTALLSIPQQGLVHPGGELTFDDTGAMYIGVGAPVNSDLAGDPNSYPGSILRIIPTATSYTIPSDNPYVAGGGLPEIYSIGYRNPFRLSWDANTGLVVSEPMWVEKNQQVGTPTPGSDAGYPDITRVKTCWVDSAAKDACTTRRDGRPVTPPAMEYTSDVGDIVSGAIVLDDSAGPVSGHVLITDWNGTVLIADPSTTPWKTAEVGKVPVTPGLVWAIDQDNDGTVYVMVTSTAMQFGEIYTVVGLDTVTVDF